MITIRMVAAVFNNEGDPEIIRLTITPDDGKDWEQYIIDTLTAAGYEPVPNWWLPEGAVQFDSLWQTAYDL